MQSITHKGSEVGSEIGTAQLLELTPVVAEIKRMGSIHKLNTTQQLIVDIYKHRNYTHPDIAAQAKIDAKKIPKLVEGEIEATCYEYEKLMTVWCRLELMNPDAPESAQIQQ